MMTVALIWTSWQLVDIYKRGKSYMARKEGRATAVMSQQSILITLGLIRTVYPSGKQYP